MQSTICSILPKPDSKTAPLTVYYHVVYCIYGVVSSILINRDWEIKELKREALVSPWWNSADKQHPWGVTVVNDSHYLTAD